MGTATCTHTALTATYPVPPMARPPNQVKESDVLKDDTYVHEKFILQWQDSNQVCEAMSKVRALV